MTSDITEPSDAEQELTLPTENVRASDKRTGEL